MTVLFKKNKFIFLLSIYRKSKYLGWLLPFFGQIVSPLFYSQGVERIKSARDVETKKMSTQSDKKKLKFFGNFLVIRY